MHGRNKTYSVFVGHVAPTVTTEEMFHLFKPYGEIYEIFRNPMQPHMSFTYCFVRYKNIESANRAVDELNNWPVAGYQLKVELAAETVGHIRKDEPVSNKPLKLEKRWMKQLAELIGSSEECAALLQEVNTAEASLVPPFSWEGAKLKLDLEALDEADKRHKSQKEQVRLLEPPVDLSEINDISIRLAQEEEQGHSRFENRAKQHRVWKFVRPDLFEDKLQGPASKETNDVEHKLLRNQSAGQILSEKVKLSPCNITDEPTSHFPSFQSASPPHTSHPHKCLGMSLTEKSPDQGANKIPPQESSGCERQCTKTKLNLTM